MQVRKILSLSALALSFAVGGCGDSTGSSTVSVTTAEGAGIFGDIFGGFLAASFVSGGSTTNGSTTTFNATGSCTGGGTVKVTGTLGGTNTVTYSITEAFTICKGTNFTLDGSVTWSGSETSDGKSGSLNIKGSLTLSGAKSGVCAIDVTITGDATGGTATGSICGTNVAGIQA